MYFVVVPDVEYPRLPFTDFIGQSLAVDTKYATGEPILQSKVRGKNKNFTHTPESAFHAGVSTWNYPGEGNN